MHANVIQMAQRVRGNVIGGRHDESDPMVHGEQIPPSYGSVLDEHSRRGGVRGVLDRFARKQAWPERST